MTFLSICLHFHLLARPHPRGRSSSKHQRRPTRRSQTLPGQFPSTRHRRRRHLDDTPDPHHPHVVFNLAPPTQRGTWTAIARGMDDFDARTHERRGDVLETLCVQDGRLTTPIRVPDPAPPRRHKIRYAHSLGTPLRVDLPHPSEERDERRRRVALSWVRRSIASSRGSVVRRWRDGRGNICSGEGVGRR